MDELKVTTFYLQDSGNIYGAWSGRVDFSVFGEDADKYESIMDFIVLDPVDMPTDLNRMKVVNGVFENK